MRGAIYVEDSGNRKIIGSKKADATYASIHSSCPKDCPLMGAGCYAELGYTAITGHRLDKEARKNSPLDTARAEAHAIDTCYDGGKIPDHRDLRLRVAGDSRLLAGSRMINLAVGRWKKRGGGDCWAYTHAYARIPRSVHSNISILASVDRVDQVKTARDMGYAPCIVVPEHISDKTYTLPNSDVKWIPCVQQTRGVGCTDCRLCFDADRLYRENMGIAFSVHGARKTDVKRRLTVVQ